MSLRCEEVHFYSPRWSGNPRWMSRFALTKWHIRWVFSTAHTEIKPNHKVYRIPYFYRLITMWTEYICHLQYSNVFMRNLLHQHENACRIWSKRTEKCFTSLYIVIIGIQICVVFIWFDVVVSFHLNFIQFLREFAGDPEQRRAWFCLLAYLSAFIHGELTFTTVGDVSSDVYHLCLPPYHTEVGNSQNNVFSSPYVFYSPIIWNNIYYCSSMTDCLHSLWWIPHFYSSLRSFPTLCF